MCPGPCGRAIERASQEVKAKGFNPKRPSGASHSDEQTGPSMSTEPVRASSNA